VAIVFVSVSDLSKSVCRFSFAFFFHSPTCTGCAPVEEAMVDNVSLSVRARRAMVALSFEVNAFFICIQLYTVKGGSWARKGVYFSPTSITIPIHISKIP
jgi:hypothetical protein